MEKIRFTPEQMLTVARYIKRYTTIPSLLMYDREYRLREFTLIELITQNTELHNGYIIPFRPSRYAAQLALEILRRCDQFSKLPENFNHLSQLSDEQLAALFVHAMLIRIYYDSRLFGRTDRAEPTTDTATGNRPIILYRPYDYEQLERLIKRHKPLTIRHGTGYNMKMARANRRYQKFKNRR